MILTMAQINTKNKLPTLGLNLNIIMFRHTYTHPFLCAYVGLQVGMCVCVCVFNNYLIRTIPFTEKTFTFFSIQKKG